MEVRVADSALAGRLGWTAGTGAPGATVHIRRDQTRETQSFGTDEEGVLHLPDLPSSRYWVWVEKRLDAPQGGAPAVLAGGRLLRLSRGSTKEIQLRGQQRGSLVISEFYYHSPTAEVLDYNEYNYQYYIELRNDADTTIYLDGKIVGNGFNYPIEAASWPCSETSRWRNEPRGLWATSFQAFPGSGTDYPVAPGATVVIAEQAIDHSAIYPGLPDMSNADFQFTWEGRATNPAVPLMLPIQFRLFPTNTVMSVLAYAPFVADALDVASLEKTQNLQGTFALFPKEHLLDVAEIYDEYYLQSTRGSTLCGHIVDPSLDALAAFASPYSTLRPDAHLLAAQRKVLPDGTLQRTGVSAADWEIRERSPGRIP
ncbi:MAG: hypothetical protein ACQERF_10580 [Actinomycetota bacterium]